MSRGLAFRGSYRGSLRHSLSQFGSLSDLDIFVVTQTEVTLVTYLYSSYQTYRNRISLGPSSTTIYLLSIYRYHYLCCYTYILAEQITWRAISSTSSKYLLASTCKNYLSAVYLIYINKKLDTSAFQSEFLYCILKGISNYQIPYIKKQAKPLTQDLLIRIIN